MSRERYFVGDLVIDVASASVTRGGRELDVAGLSFDLLVALARRAPDVLGVEDLVASVWKGDVVSDETVVQRVALLRRALDDDAREPIYVRSIRGRGYRIVPEVLSRRAATTSLGRRLWLSLAAAAAVVTATVLLWPEPPDSSRPAKTAYPSVAELVARADEYRARHQEADTELAASIYRSVLERVPDQVEALAGLSLALSQGVTKFNHTGAERDQALKLAKRALEVAPDHAGANYAHALALDSRGQVAAAIEGYLRADELGGGVSGLASAAYLFQVQGRLARALQANLEVYDRFPQAHYVEVQIATTLGLLGFEDAAVIWFERAHTLRPDNVFAALALAQFRLSGGRLDEAERVAEQALSDGIRRSELHAVLGHVAELRGLKAEAALHYRGAIEVSVRSCVAATRLWLLDPSDMGGDAGGICFGPPGRVFPAVILDDEYPAAWVNAVVAYASGGDTEKALAFLDSAIELGYRDADWLLLDPLLQGLRSEPEFIRRIERIRGLLEEERAEVLSSPWLPEGLVAPPPPFAS